MADVKQIFSVSKDILTILVIPALGWIIKLEVDNAVRDEKIKELQSEVSDLQSVKGSVQGIEVNVGKVQEKLNGVDQKVDSIYRSLFKVPSP